MGINYFQLFSCRHKKALVKGLQVILCVNGQELWVKALVKGLQVILCVNGQELWVVFLTMYYSRKICVMCLPLRVAISGVFMKIWPLIKKKDASTVSRNSLLPCSQADNLRA
jgi:hypothetical protein